MLRYVIPVTSVPSRADVVRGGQVTECRRALQHVFPLAPDARDLHEVVHHGDRREADLLGSPGDGAEPTGGLRRAARPREPPDLQTEAQGHGFLLLAAGGERRVVESGGDDDDRLVLLGTVDGLEAFAVDRRDGSGHRLELARHQGRGHRLGPPTVAGAALPLGCVDEHGVAWHVSLLRQCPHPGPEGGLEGGRVDHREQTPGEPLGDDQLQHFERVGAGPQVVAVAPHDGPQVVPGHDRRPLEPGAGPARLARSRHPDHHDQARVRQANRHDLDPRLSPHRRSCVPEGAQETLGCSTAGL